jgi:small subunit ribosomal protein S15
MSETETTPETIVAKHQSHAKDTGSTKVQVALLTERINELTGHLKTHRKDFDSRSGLLKMVGRRRRLLNYLASSEPDVYAGFIKELGLRK